MSEVGRSQAVLYVSQIIREAFDYQNEPAIIVADNDSELAKALGEAYHAALPLAQMIWFKKGKKTNGASPKVKRTNKGSVSSLKKKAWEVFSKYIRLRDCLEYDSAGECGRCVTCKRIYPLKQLQAGHFVDSRTKPVLFNEDIVYAQCAGCNVFKKGNKDEYTPFMIEKFGPEKVLEFLELRHSKDKTWSKHELEVILEKYKLSLEELCKKIA